MGGAAGTAMKLLDLIDPRSIVAELVSRERNGVIRELVQSLADSGRIAPDSVETIARTIITRERTRGTTGFGKGVAAPHAKLEGLPQIVAAVGRSGVGVDFESLDGQPVFGVILLLSPADQPESHLRAMDLLFRVLQQERFRKFLRQSDSAEKILDLFREADEKPLSS